MHVLKTEFLSMISKLEKFHQFSNLEEKIFQVIIGLLPLYPQLHVFLNEYIDFLTTNNFLSRRQWGFCFLHSTVLALLDCTNEWLLNIDQGGINTVFFLHIKKAFDTVKSRSSTNEITVLWNKRSRVGVSHFILIRTITVLQC